MLQTREAVSIAVEREAAKKQNLLISQAVSAAAPVSALGRPVKRSAGRSVL
jgi:hypothetical protein